MVSTRGTLRGTGEAVPRNEVVVYSDEYMNYLDVTFTLKDGEVSLVGDPCRCYDYYFSPLSIEEMKALGFEEAP
jgi:hypothetical protein